MLENSEFWYALTDWYERTPATRITTDSINKYQKVINVLSLGYDR
jgi:hypothetical protein